MRSKATSTEKSSGELEHRRQTSLQGRGQSAVTSLWILTWILKK